MPVPPRSSPTVSERIDIRPLEPADVPDMLRIIADSRREYGIADRGIELLERADRDLYATYQRQRSMYFVAVRGGEIAGGAGIAPLSAADPLTCELQRMYVRADARRAGIGDALLQRCLTAARQFLFVRCYLETISPMKPALSFYERHGFSELAAPLAETGHAHNDRWLLRPLRASARAAVKPTAWPLDSPPMLAGHSG